MVRISCAVALALAALPASAQESEVQKLREDVRRLQQRVDEQQKTTARPQGRSSFNPEISVILQGTFARSSQDPEAYQITGFAPSGGEVGPARRGFSLSESELIFSANVDPYLRGQLTAALTPEDEVEVEEAYFQTLSLGRGFSLKGGRFLSGIGYQNEIHQHAWDFQDAPLVHKAYLGGRLSDDGVQVRWVAPTDLFIELGAEAGRGRSFPGTDRDKSGSSAGSVFAHLGGDLGASLAWRAGLSYLATSPVDRGFEDQDSIGEAVAQSFSGKSKLWIADFVLKWAPGGNASSTNFKLQGEYFRRKESGTVTYDDTAQAAPQFGAAFTDSYSSSQSGWYLQGVYQFVRRWRAGYRYDRLNHGTVTNGIVDNGLGPTAADFPLLMTDYNPTRQTVMIDFSPSEFSRFRLQLAADKSRQGVTDNQVLLQYILSLGAHGGHKF
jgi:hypothetical protein